MTVSVRVLAAIVFRSRHATSSAQRAVTNGRERK